MLPQLRIILQGPNDETDEMDIPANMPLSRTIGEMVEKLHLNLELDYYEILFNGIQIDLDASPVDFGFTEGTVLQLAFKNNFRYVDIDYGAKNLALPSNQLKVSELVDLLTSRQRIAKGTSQLAENNIYKIFDTENLATGH